MRYLVLFCMLVTAATACKKPADKPTTGGGGDAAAMPDFHDPASAGFATQAPDSFRARFTTSKGEFVIAVHRAWAPRGADRFYNLVRSGYYDGVRFFRVVPGFMERDEGERELPYEKYPWDGVSGVRPFHELAEATTVGVY
mgnify:CR=1 FL=1